MTLIQHQGWKSIELQRLSWMDNGNCVGVTNNSIFFVPDKDAKKQRAAKKICSGCPVKALCLKWGIETESVGIFGGMTETERNLLLALLKAKRMTLDAFLDIPNQTPEQKTHTETNISYIPKPVRPPETSNRPFQLVI